MESIIDKLQAITTVDQSNDLIFIAEIDGKPYSIMEAAEKKLVGKVVANDESRKNTILKMLLNKERMNIQDLEVIIATFEETINILWSESGYKFKKDNLARIKEVVGTTYAIK